MESTLEKNKTTKVVHMYTKENLDKTLLKVIDEEIANKKLIKYLNDLFSKKGMNKNTVAGLFTQGKKLSMLTKMEKIAFTQGCYDVLKWDYLEPEKNFSVQDLNSFDAYFVVEPIIDTMRFKYCRKIDDYTYETYVSYEDLNKWYVNTLITYNSDSQRAGVLKELGTKGNYIKDISLKDKSVVDIKEAMINKDYEEDMIIFNVRMIRGAIPNFEWIPILDNIIGDINITPNYERESSSQTVCECIDGWHRLSAVVKAVNEYKKNNDNKELKGGLFVKIVMRDIEQAKKIVRQTFMRSDTDKKWIDSLKETDYTGFADLLISKTNLLKENVADNYEDCVISKALTYKWVIAETIEKCCPEIPVNSKSEIKWITEDMSRIIDEIIDYIKSMYYPTIDMIKNDSVLLDINMIAGYIAMANTIKSIEGFDNYEKLVDELYLLDRDDSIRLKLNDKTVHIRTVYEFFVNMVKGVVE